ncbi:MAG: zinc ribbon domain-containing protein [Gemmatimonadaceae bacterium]
MPTYLYETVPSTQADDIERFEVRQSFSDPVLEVHPTTGAPVRRVISGGMGVMSKGGGQSMPEPGPGCGPGSCGCGRF